MCVSVEQSPDTAAASAGCAFTVPAASVFATLARSVSAAVSACAVFSDGETAYWSRFVRLQRDIAAQRKCIGTF